MLRRVGIFYLAALIIGLGTIALQFILSHSGTDMSHDMDMGSGGADGGHDLSHDMQGPLMGAAALFLSMRFWTFALMAFGIVGTALHYLDLCGAAGTLVLAAGSGFGSGLLAAWVFRNLTRGVSSSETSADAVGHVARVLVPMKKGQSGKVRVQIKGKVIDMVATTDSESIEGDEVLVVEMRDTSAHVEPVVTRRDDT
jgi:membrane protein implicated in regulation of membrane protease activity